MNRFQLKVKINLKCFGMEPELTSEDVKTLSEVPGVQAVIATNQGWGPMVYNDQAR